MSVYSNQQIRQAVAEGRIVCYPFSEDSVGEAGLDVTLGYYYYRAEPTGGRALYYPFDRESMERYFDGPYRARPHGEWCRQNGFELVSGIPENHPVITLRPGERILAHTHEFFGVLSPGAGEINTMTEWAQNGINIFGGWLELGRIERVTLEVRNSNQSETVLLPVGEHIAHVVFHEMGTTSTGQTTVPDSSKQSKPTVNLETIIKTWSPSLILPQADRSRRALPPKIEGMSYD